MTTAADLIQATHRHLMAGQREARNRLSGSLTASDTTLTFEFDLAGIRAGSYVCVELEVMYVWSVNDSAKTAVVQRGELGSTAAIHADNSIVHVNPPFSCWSIFSALNDELRDLSSPANGLYQVKTVTLTYRAPYTGYDLTGVTDLIDVLEVRYELEGDERSWPLLRNWQVARGMSTAKFASGLALLTTEPAEEGNPVQVRYKSGFSPLAAGSDVVETVSGMSSTAMDILPMGAAIRVGAGREVARNLFERQGDTRRAEEVRSGAQLQAFAALRDLRERRISAERARLQAQWPVRLQR
jgi:hypothetical protein